MFINEQFNGHDLDLMYQKEIEEYWFNLSGRDMDADFDLLLFLMFVC
jgi:hypothetical protein